MSNTSLYIVAGFVIIEMFEWYLSNSQNDNCHWTKCSVFGIGPEFLGQGPTITKFLGQGPTITNWKYFGATITKVICSSLVHRTLGHQLPVDSHPQMRQLGYSGITSLSIFLMIWVEFLVIEVIDALLFRFTSTSYRAFDVVRPARPQQFSFFSPSFFFSFSIPFSPLCPVTPGHPCLL